MLFPHTKQTQTPFCFPILYTWTQKKHNPPKNVPIHKKPTKKKKKTQKEGQKKQVNIHKETPPQKKKKNHKKKNPKEHTHEQNM